MIDPYGREITHLRISVTQRCNLSCSYCHREGEVSSGNEMSSAKIQEIVRCAVKIGIKKIKITGGEPLLRQDIIEIISKIRAIDGVEDIGLTTNGTLLAQIAIQLKKTGLDRVNISCDSYSRNLVSPKYVENILPGLLAAKSAGLYPIKLNMVVLRTNHHEIENMIEFASRHNVILQLIELTPNFDPLYYEANYFSLDSWEDKFTKMAEKIEIREMQARSQYYLTNTIVEIVRPTHIMFCKNCNKIRITSDGKIKPCLMMANNSVEFRDETSFIDAINRKVIYNLRYAN